MAAFSKAGQWLRTSIGRRFNLNIDKADEQEVIATLTKNSNFIGANVWTLVFAIFIASIGLNINSVAVIIGAMLISPLMGPVMGIGLGIGINDFELVKRGIRNLLVASAVGVVTSTLYFLVTPIDTAQSELLALTRPSVWDVFVAFLGGMAGIVAATRKEKSNVIQGVAIATALMPPLCTAGYGIATGHLYYVLGAVYIYSINSVFICISTFLIIRLLKFRKKQFDDKGYERRVSRYIVIIIVVTVLPSIYLTYGIIQKSIFESNAALFVKEQFRFRNTQVVNKTFAFGGDRNTIDLLLIGYELPRPKLDSIRQTLPKYGLEGTRLVVRQGLNARQEIDLSQIRASILEDVFAHDSLVHEPASDAGYPDILGELTALYPAIRSYSATDVIERRASGRDTFTLFTADFAKPLPAAERKRLGEWLKQRLQADSVKVVIMN